MSVVARWRQATGRMPFVQGRLPAAVPAVLGSVLAAAAIIWPVLQISQSIGPPGASSGFMQLLWSWGRYEVTGDEAGTQRGAVNLMPAYVLAGACAAGLLGGLAWLLRRGPDGRVLGSAGVAFALAVVGGSALQRLGDAALYESVEATGFEVMTLPAGRAALAGSALLLAALLLMLWRPVVALVRSSWVAGAGMAARGRERALADDKTERAGPGPTPRVGTARLRDASPLGGGPAGGNERSRDGVGFSDGTSEQDPLRRPTWPVRD